MYGTDLETTLARDSDGSELRALLVKLESARNVIGQQMNTPQEPAEFRRLTALWESFGAAQSALKKMWRRMRRLEKAPRN